MGDALGDDGLELGERVPGQRVNVPALQVAAGRRALRLDDDLLDDLGIDRLVEEGAAGDARVDSFENVHKSPGEDYSPASLSGPARRRGGEGSSSDCGAPSAAGSLCTR